MHPYKNLSGQSNVTAYEIGENFINVKFGGISKDGSDTYLYTHAHTGVHHVEHMKKLATVGLGLNSYIQRYVRKLYASKH